MLQFLVGATVETVITVEGESPRQLHPVGIKYEILCRP